VEAEHRLDAPAQAAARSSPRRGRADGMLTRDQLAERTGTISDELAALLDVQLPRPGDGDTWARYEFLRDLARSDLCLARLVETHLDATATLAELDATVPQGFGAVWAARPEELEVAPISGGWALWGSKPFCCGAPWCTWALVVGREPGGGTRLVRLKPAELAVFDPASWPSVGMAGSFSYTARFVGVVDDDAVIGATGAYRQRPGYWHASIGLAACGLGGAQGLLDELDAGDARARGADGRLGRTLARLAAADALIERAAQEIDHDPFDTQAARRRALLVRTAVADAASAARTTASLLASADQWCRGPGWARRVADLDVYLGMHHASEDDALVGLEHQE
jgi:alkylation response protein AidB-like acyl-CoA dehydrogenase